MKKIVLLTLFLGFLYTVQIVPVPHIYADSGQAVINVDIYKASDIDKLMKVLVDFDRPDTVNGYESHTEGAITTEKTGETFSAGSVFINPVKEPEEQPVPVTRNVTLAEKQRLELSYPGQGWVYVGEQSSQQGLRYEQRKIQDNTSVFTFTAEKKGVYVLHFSYFDVFTDNFITDAVSVTVEAEKSLSAKAKVIAPEYKAKTVKTAVEQQIKTSDKIDSALSNEKNIPQAQAVESAAAALIQKTQPEKESRNAEDLLKKALAAVDAADSAAALSYLDQFFDDSQEHLDEGWFLRARAYELNGSERNIKLALQAYNTIVSSFPQSRRWEEADARRRYITNFYINIR